MLRKIHKFTLAISCLLILIGCQPVSDTDAQIDVFNKLSEVKIIKIIRSDLLKVIINEETQTVHIAGIKAPSPKIGKYNKDFSEKVNQSEKLINEVGKQGRLLARELTQDRKIRFVEFGTNTISKSGKVILDGDFIFENKSTLAEKLLSYGAAIAPFNKYRTSLDYKHCEEKAKKNELGLWRHPVKLKHRFYVRSSFESENVNIDRVQIKEHGNGRNARLESHKEFDKQGKIFLEIRTRKPLFHPYDLKIKYAFVKRKDYGKRIQEINSAPLRGELRDSRSSKKRYKPLTSAEKDYNRKLERKNREYNRKVSGQKVFDLDSSRMANIALEFASLSTNLTIESDIVHLTKSTKAGTSYSHGEYYVGYDLEIYAGTNLVYSHYYNK